MLSSRTLLFLGLLVFAAAARISLTGVDAPVTDLALRGSGNLETYNEPWSGTTEIEPRRNALALLGIATAYITTAVVGTCTIAAVMPGALPFCMAGIGFSVFLGVIFTAAAIIAGTTKRDFNDLNNLVQFHYPSIAGGPSMFSQMQEAFADSGDGLPIEMGYTDCYNFDYDCQKLWYSNTMNASGTGLNVHRILNTPAEFDFRASQDESLKPTPTIKGRQATYSDTATETESGGAGTYYGGYVFQTDNDPAETAIAQDDDNSSDQAASAQDIVTAMSDQYTANNDKFGSQGSYCMDLEEASNSQVGLDGYLWVYDDPSSAPTGEDETSFLGTCTEESG